MKQQNTTTNKVQGYSVTPETSALLDCLREASTLYTHILNAIEPLRYPKAGEDWTEEVAAVYLPHVAAISDAIQEELTRRLNDTLSDTANTKKENILI